MLGGGGHSIRLCARLLRGTCQFFSYVPDLAGGGAAARLDPQPERAQRRPAGSRAGTDFELREEQGQPAGPSSRLSAGGQGCSQQDQEHQGRPHDRTLEFDPLADCSKVQQKSRQKSQGALAGLAGWVYKGPVPTAHGTVLALSFLPSYNTAAVPAASRALSTIWEAPGCNREEQSSLRWTGTD